MSLLIEGEKFFKGDNRFRLFGIPESLRGMRLIRGERDSPVEFFDMEVNVPAQIYVAFPSGSTFPLEPLEEHMWKAQICDVTLYLNTTEEPVFNTSEAYHSKGSKATLEQKENRSLIQRNYGAIGTSTKGKRLTPTCRETANAIENVSLFDATEHGAHTKLSVMTIKHKGGTIGFKVSSKVPFIIAVGPLKIENISCGEAANMYILSVRK